MGRLPGIGDELNEAAFCELFQAESAREAARRETREEIGATPTEVSPAGELLFQFADGYALHCEVFTARDIEGKMIETEEAAPFWTEISAIPYGEMWADDAHWIPWMLAGRPFRGFFCFDGDRMLSCRLRPRD